MNFIESLLFKLFMQFADFWNETCENSIIEEEDVKKFFETYNF